jgi:hypothetical protein
VRLLARIEAGEHVDEEEIRRTTREMKAGAAKAKTPAEQKASAMEGVW